MHFVLPLPPGINRTYGVSSSKDHHMYKTKIVKDWEEEAGYRLLIQKQKYDVPILSKASIGIHWYYKLDRDIDAGFKVLLDIFQKNNIVKNDRQFRKVTHIDIEKDIDNPRVEVDIEKLP